MKPLLAAALAFAMLACIAAMLATAAAPEPPPPARSAAQAAPADAMPALPAPPAAAVLAPHQHVTGADRRAVTPPSAPRPTAADANAAASDDAASVPPAAALAQCRDLLARIDAGDDDPELVRSLRDLLVASPALAAHALDLLREPRRTGVPERRLVQALALAGTDSTRRALVGAARDPLVSAAARSLVLRALGDLPRPDAPALDTLWLVATDPTTPPALARTALLAYGRATATLRPHHVDHATALARLHAATNPAPANPLLRRALQSALQTATSP